MHVTDPFTGKTSASFLEGYSKYDTNSSGYTLSCSVSAGISLGVKFK
jgi:hypothetical protein